MKVVKLLNGVSHRFARVWVDFLSRFGAADGRAAFYWGYSEQSRDGETWGQKWKESQGSDPIAGWAVKGRQATLRDFWDILEDIPESIPHEKNNEDLTMEDLPGFYRMDRDLRALACTSRFFYNKLEAIVGEKPSLVPSKEGSACTPGSLGAVPEDCLLNIVSFVREHPLAPKEVDGEESLAAAAGPALGGAGGSVL